MASEIAKSILAPWRMIPCCSTAVPTTNPGTSCRNTSGIPKASHSHTNRAALSAEFTSRAPPRTIGLEATMPTARPPTRASPVTTLRAHAAFISKNEPGSTTSAMTLCMS